LESAFLQIAATLAVAALFGTLAMVLRQPLIVAFIAVGILVGPASLGWVEAGNELDLLASLGIGILLFLVGLKLDPKLIRTTGPVALATGLGQVAFTSLVGFGIGIALGFDVVPAIYIAVALTFSSTIIIVKLLSDKRELDELHGRIAVGFLIVQDIVVVIALIVITALGDAGGDRVATQLVAVLARGIAFLVVLLALMRWVLPALVGRIARNRELLVLFGVAWGIGLAGVGEWLGFSVEVGAFLAGFSLAATPYREAIASRLVSLRDFLLLFFFIDLGAKLEFDTIGGEIGPAIIFSLFVLIGNPLIVLVIMGAMRYRSRTSFLAGLTVAQISEFSLILVALGVRVGHVEDSILGLVTMVGLITIGLSTYLILYSKPLYERMAPLLSIFERDELNTGEQMHEDSEGDVDVIVFGGGRHGTLVTEGLQSKGLSVMVVDLDPDALRACQKRGISVMYGDAEDPEFLLSLPLHQVGWVISTVRGPSIHLALLHGLRAAGYDGEIAFTAHDNLEAARLKEENVGMVVAPFAIAAERLVSTVVASGGNAKRSRRAPDRTEPEPDGEDE
jgi:Kef-type K+ transport system membrane component KefB